MLKSLAMPTPARLIAETLPELRPPVVVRKRSAVKRANGIIRLPISSGLPLSNGSRKERRVMFLRALSGVKRYKRFLGSPLRYGGGKSLAVGHIVENIPANVQKMVSPFMGGGALEIACARHLGIKVLACDIFDILANYWQMQINAPKKLHKLLARWQPQEEQYRTIKTRLRAHWKDEEKLPPDELAAHYYFNHNLSYGPGFLGWMSKIYADGARYENMIARVRDFDGGDLHVECADFADTIKANRCAFLYCDPPYYLGGDSKMFRGIYPMRNFPVHHDNFDHEKLRDMLHSHRAGFILSYNDCSVVREWYKDFDIVEVAWQYTMGQGETRIGYNRINDKRNHTKKSHELLIIKQ